MINRNIQRRFAKALDEGYNKTNLQSAFYTITTTFISKELDLCTKEGFALHELKLPSSSIKKGELAAFVSIPFASQTLFQRFKTYLKPDVITVLDELVWMDSLSATSIEKNLEIEVYDTKINSYGRGYSSSSFALKPEFEIFKDINASYSSFSREPLFVLQLPLDFRKLLVEYYDKPQGAEFEAIETIDATDFIFHGEQDILLELPRVLIYKDQDQIKVTAKDRPQASTLNKMQKKLSLKEFYPENTAKELKNLRTGLLASLIVKMDSSTTRPDVAQNLRLLAKKYYRSHFNSSQGILTYLKGSASIDRYNSFNNEPTLYHVLQHMPINEWISIENIEKYIQYNLIDVKPISEYTAYNKLYYVVEEGEGRFAYRDKRYISKNLYYDSVIQPLIKGTCFLFAAYGLLDIAYDTPDVSEIGITAKSPYDGLKYVRLNPLGAFAMDQQPDYEVPTTITQSSIRLSEDSLTIVIDETDTTAPIILEPYTQRVSPNRFKTDYSHFLKDVKTLSDVNQKINLFKQSVKVKMPKNWELFFEELRQKIDPLEKVTTMKIFRIPSENKELLQIIAKDAILKNLCLKAEGFHVLVTVLNYPKFKKRLQEFGYLMS